MPYDAQPRANAGTGGAPTSKGQTERPQMDHPSTKYREIEMPNPVTMHRSSSPPRPTLPRRSEPRSWKATARERIPLTSSLTGPGRAGKQGTLLGVSGGRYEGEVLAGRPHGRGQYFVQKEGSSSKEWILQYDGDWIQGRREGYGTRYYPTGEVYSGDWVANIRHGTGRYEYANGDMYVGQWADDKRNGAGTLYMASGDIFIGNFMADRREGMGTLYMMARQKKYLAEYVRDSPRCGTVLEIDDSDLAPLRGHLASMAAARKLDAAAAGEAIARLPPLQLLQPSKVLAEQVVAVRRERQQGGSKALKAVQAASGNLSERDIEMLRHSYTLMAAGDGPEVGLLPHQLRELVVMAGLDPAAPATRSLVEELMKRRAPTTGRISFDSFMLVVTHFQDEAVKAEATAAVDAAAAQAAATFSATAGARGVAAGTGMAHMLAGTAAAAADAAAAEAADVEADARLAAVAEEEGEGDDGEAVYDGEEDEETRAAAAAASRLPAPNEGHEEEQFLPDGEEAGAEEGEGEDPEKAGQGA
ncbi:hypothetical protein PLESTB_000996000 [Pleodorina starrii]|uniref:MORN repeat-containing protein 3 n=1 Tax=Pleodorina starrii TaxID=330485 RepID=A0A9W6BNR6_9CHLO|nr:hypothetical protein PLESTM_001855000 [Pleodorina starrii]GLC55517.1 hypothetical protein PLESTB_000996000 [Pleodorina starrii]GLC76398.1 hypothetical protein PLESTF_001776200 [Pleodorina starrii]